MSLIVKAIILGIVQGLTEFLPISSTGHMIIVDEFLHLPESFRDPFLVMVQLGSILSVVVYFFRRLLPAGFWTNPVTRLSTLLLWSKVLVGVFPALLIGGLFGSKIQHALYSTPTVAVALLIGGVLLILLERRKSIPRILTMPQLGWRHALGVGLAQCIAMIPGVSRSAATILGGLGLGLSRDLAVEYSFFLAIPTMCAASAYSVLKDGLHFSHSEWTATAAGFITAFVVALGVIAGLMRFIRKHDFQFFGWYRIVLGIILLLGLALKAHL
ncbi:MAG: undecaprenyl-diphosphate phosphatase [Victivallales bacterium]|nr:undecaprenyl-diphosphate phosphatase [Victivallales bacterium]